MSNEHAKTPDAKRMTLVFNCDARSLKQNIHRTDTPFGRACVVSAGDLVAENAALENRVADLERELSTAKKSGIVEGLEIAAKIAKPIPVGGMYFKVASYHSGDGNSSGENPVIVCALRIYEAICARKSTEEGK